jgi:hypothetical protein
MYIASMAVRVPGTEASFDAARQKQFLAAVQKASPSALNASITSITPVSAGRRRLLASFLDIAMELWYKDKAAAESAAASDLTESSLNSQMLAAGLDALTVTAQPTVRSAADALPSGEGEAAIPAWAIIVASVGGVVMVGGGAGVALLVWRKKRRNPPAVFHCDVDLKSILEGKDFEMLKATVLAGIEHFDNDETKFGEEAKDLIMGRPVEAAGGLEALLCVKSKTDFHRRIGLEVAGIEEEVKQFVDEHGGNDDAGVREVQELFNYIVNEGTSEKEYPNGIRDKGRPPGTRLDYFVSHPKARKAELSAAHVVALRMYTTSIYKYMNNPLRDRERRKKNIACPLPVTTW